MFHGSGVRESIIDSLSRIAHSPILQIASTMVPLLYLFAMGFLPLECHVGELRLLFRPTPQFGNESLQYHEHLFLHILFCG